jgi:hypothetical protein
MFGLSRKKDPVKQMDKRLAPLSPEAGTWKHLAAYLVKGQRPSGDRERAILRAYLGMKEHLGPEAAFRLGADLEYGSLAGPCRGFFCEGGAYEAREGADLMHWACFLLAADHLLARAHEASLAERNNRDKVQTALQTEWERCEREFFTPLSRDMSGGRREVGQDRGVEEGMPTVAEAVAA